MTDTTRSLQEQLAPLARQFQPRTSKLRDIVCVAASLKGEDRAAAAKSARMQTLKWVQNQTSPLPEQAWDFETFDHEIPVNPASAVRHRTAETDQWALRFDAQDKEKPERTWRTEVLIVLDRETAMFGLRLTIASVEDLAEYVPSVPRLVRHVADRPGLSRNGRSIENAPWRIDNDDEVAALVDLICASDRRRPVIVATLPEQTRSWSEAAFDVDKFAQRAIGIAHVAILQAEQTYALTRKLSREFSAFNGAVRTYRPGFDPSTSSRFDHPLALREKITNWQDNGASAFIDTLMREAAFASIRSTALSHDLPRFTTIREASLKFQREKLEDDDTKKDELLTNLRKQVEYSKKSADEFMQMADAEESSRVDAEKRAKEAEEQLWWMSDRISELEKKIEWLTKKSFSEQIDIPDNLDRLHEWLNKNLSGKIVVTAKALRSTKNAYFNDHRLVYKAILLLANEYTEMKRKDVEIEDKIAFKKKLETLGLENSRSGQEHELRGLGDEFLVEYRGKKQLLKWHLKNNGNSRDPARCFRLYYFWDDETNMVVIGSLPGHLKTRLS